MSLVRMERFKASLGEDKCIDWADSTFRFFDTFVGSDGGVGNAILLINETKAVPDLAVGFDKIAARHGLKKKLSGFRCSALCGIDTCESVEDCEAHILGEQVGLLRSFDRLRIRCSLKETEPCVCVVVVGQGLTAIEEEAKTLPGANEVALRFRFFSFLLK